MNFIEISREMNIPILSLNSKQKDKIDFILQQDSMFLYKQKIMDYSLLLVVERLPIE